MNGKIDDGGQAFPGPSIYRSSNFPSMSLRQWYAGMAMQGICSMNAALPNELVGKTSKWYAVAAFMVADAMIEQGKK